MPIDPDVNIAELLHNIAAESDAISGKIIRQAHKAANKGKSSITVRIAEDDAESIGTKFLTPPMEKLTQLGFKLGLQYHTVWYDNLNKYPFLIVRW